MWRSLLLTLILAGTLTLAQHTSSREPRSGHHPDDGQHEETRWVQHGESRSYDAADEEGSEAQDEGGEQQEQSQHISALEAAQDAHLANEIEGNSEPLPETQALVQEQPSPIQELAQQSPFQQTQVPVREIQFSGEPGQSPHHSGELHQVNGNQATIQSIHETLVSRVLAKEQQGIQHQTIAQVVTTSNPNPSAAPNQILPSPQPLIQAQPLQAPSLGNLQLVQNGQAQLNQLYAFQRPQQPMHTVFSAQTHLPALSAPLYSTEIQGLLQNSGFELVPIQRPQNKILVQQSVLAPHTFSTGFAQNPQTVVQTLAGPSTNELISQIGYRAVQDTPRYTVYKVKDSSESTSKHSSALRSQLIRQQQAQQQQLQNQQLQNQILQQQQLRNQQIQRQDLQNQQIQEQQLLTQQIQQQQLQNQQLQQQQLHNQQIQQQIVQDQQTQQQHVQVPQARQQVQPAQQQHQQQVQPAPQQHQQQVQPAQQQHQQQVQYSQQQHQQQVQNSQQQHQQQFQHSQQQHQPQIQHSNQKQQVQPPKQNVLRGRPPKVIQQLRPTLYSPTVVPTGKSQVVYKSSVDPAYYNAIKAKLAHTFSQLNSFEGAFPYYRNPTYEGHFGPRPLLPPPMQPYFPYARGGPFYSPRFRSDFYHDLALRHEYLQRRPDLFPGPTVYPRFDLPGPTAYPRPDLYKRPVEALYQSPGPKIVSALPTIRKDHYFNRPDAHSPKHALESPLFSSKTVDVEYAPGIELPLNEVAFAAAQAKKLGGPAFIDPGHIQASLGYKLNEKTAELEPLRTRPVYPVPLKSSHDFYRRIPQAQLTPRPFFQPHLRYTAPVPRLNHLPQPSPHPAFSHTNYRFQPQPLPAPAPQPPGNVEVKEIEAGHKPGLPRDFLAQLLRQTTGDELEFE